MKCINIVLIYIPHGGNITTHITNDIEYSLDKNICKKKEIQNIGNIYQFRSPTTKHKALYYFYSNNNKAEQ